MFCADINAQKYIVFEPAPTLDTLLGDPSGYILIQVDMNDSVQTIGTYENFVDSSTTVPVNIDTTYDMINNANNFIFTYYNTLHGCFSEKISYQIDSAHSSFSKLYITEFLIDLYQLFSDSLVLCNNNPDTTWMPTNIPFGNYFFYSPDGLDMDSSGNIIPANSVPDSYNVILESEYCYYPLGDSLIKVIILDTTTPDVPDTLYYCSGTDNSDMPISNYNILGINGDGGDIESGIYQVVPDNYNQNQCVDTAFTYVKVIPEPGFPLITTEELCDRVVLSLDFDRGYDKILWSDGSGSNSVEVTQSGYVDIEVTDQYGCLSSDSVYVEFLPLKIEMLDFTVTDADCWTEGAVQINSLITSKNVPEDQQHLVNVLTATYVSDLNNISEGVYRLEVSDSHDCTDQSEEKIVVKQKCIEDYPVFSPNQDGLEDEYFIPHEGSIKIFNRNGTLLNEFDTPAYWDGTDFSGNQLPMGNYIIVTDNNKPVNITLVR